MTNVIQKPIGLLGGTFDPIHIGHLRMALEIQEIFQLEKIHVIPCYEPVHRPHPCASPEQRFEMVKCAVQDMPNFIADPREIKRAKSSYTIDTITEMRHEMPNTPLCLLLGVDAFLDFPNWHRYEKILECAHLIIAHRPNYHLPTEGLIADLLKVRLDNNSINMREKLGGKIWLQPITALEISSSTIRSQLSNKKNPKYLVPDVIYQYIKQYEIY